jgi:hypothetical protein
VLSILLSVVLVSFPSAYAYLDNAELPLCFDGDNEVQVDNEQILKYKRDTRNQFQARGYIQGKILAMPDVINDHDHFAISIGSGPRDTIEVIYNRDREFGPMPNVNVGDEIVVCGDYITSSAKSGRYEASPQGAIIHWVHYNPGNRNSKHEHGFIYFPSERTLVGFDDAPTTAWSGTVGGDHGSSSSRDRSGGYDGGNRPRKKKRHLLESDDWSPCTSLAECSERNDSY